MENRKYYILFKEWKKNNAFFYPEVKYLPGGGGGGGMGVYIFFQITSLRSL